VHDPRFAVELCVEHDSRHQPPVYRAEIANRGPHRVGMSIECDVLVNGSHDDLFL
jgi:hypothetical protein